MPRKRKTKFRTILILFLFFVFISLLLPGKRGILNQIHVRYQQNILIKEIEHLQKEKQDLQAKKDTLENPETVERIAREKYGMAKKEENVYRVVPKEKKNAE